MLDSKLSLPVLLFFCLVFSIILYFQSFPSKDFDSIPPVEKVSSPSTPESKARQSNSYGHLPIRFEANVGQTDERVKFLARDKGYSLFLTPQEAVMVLPIGPAKTDPGPIKKISLENNETRHAAIRMSLLNANPSPKMLGEDELITKSNYFIGSDPEKWQTGVSNYSQVRYEDAYPGIDLIYYGNPQQLEYDFIVSPGVDPDVIKIKFEGQNAIEIDESGNLVLKVESGRVVQNAPVVYQQNDGKRIPVQGRYVLLGEDSVGFRIGEYDPEKDLIIDPSVVFSTYLGGSAGNDDGLGIAVDSTGNVYIVGSTTSSNFPTVGAIDSTLGGTDAFVSKLNATGTALTYSTYLGGSSTEFGTAIAVDSSGNAYVIGQTNSINFPFVGGSIDSTLGGTTDAFVSKLNAAGSALTYSTYLGGASTESGAAIAVDSSGNAYVTGNTPSADFPFVGGVDSSLDGIRDAYISKLNAAGSALTYSTYLGGAAIDSGSSIAVDSSGNAYVIGNTQSSDFPFVGGSIDSTLGGTQDAFISKLNAAGSALTYSTYLGGAAFESGNGIAVDSSGNAYLTGYSTSSDFPFVGGVDSSQDGSDAFVSKLNAAGSALTYSTYLGGTSTEIGNGIAVDSSGNAYVTGDTDSSDFPFLGGVDSSLDGTTDAFISKLNAAGSALTFSTYLGGTGIDNGKGIAVDSSGNAYLTGKTLSTDFPFVGGSIDSTLGGTNDAFVIKYLLAVLPSSAPFPPFEVVAPYWQAEAGIYTFVSIGHASLSGMNSGIGVVMTALNTNGSLQGSLEFTVSSGTAQRAFITTTNFFFGPDSNPGDRFLIIDSSGLGTGNLGFSSKATNPLVKLGGASISGSGFGDIRALTFWGAIVISSSATGFAMEFIGDMQDSRAFSSANFSGLN